MTKKALVQEIRACRQELKETGSAYRQNENYQKRYIELIRESRDGFAMLDKDGRFVFCNDEYCNITGYDAEALKNETYKSLTPVEYHQLDRENLKKMFESGFSDLYEKEYVRNDGVRVPIEIRSYLIRDERGDFSGTWSYVTYISLF